MFSRDKFALPFCILKKKKINKREKGESGVKKRIVKNLQIKFYKLDFY